METKPPSLTLVNSFQILKHTDGKEILEFKLVDLKLALLSHILVSNSILTIKKNILLKLTITLFTRKISMLDLPLLLMLITNHFNLHTEC